MAASKLYYVANGSQVPTKLTFEVPVLQDVLQVAGLPPTRGTHRQPVLGFRLIGVGFRDAAPTFMEPHSMSSGGKHC